MSDKALYRYLQHHPEVNEIIFCYDNNMDGKLKDCTPHNHDQVQAELPTKTFSDLRYSTFIKTPKSKDFSLDLLAFRWTATHMPAADLGQASEG